MWCLSILNGLQWIDSTYQERDVHYLANTLSLMPFSFPYCTDCTSVRPLETEDTETVSGVSENTITKMKVVENFERFGLARFQILISTAKFTFTCSFT